MYLITIIATFLITITLFLQLKYVSSLKALSNEEIKVVKGDFTENSNGPVKGENILVTFKSTKKNVNQEYEYFGIDLNASEAKRKADLVNESNNESSNGTKRIEITNFNFTNVSSLKPQSKEEIEVVKSDITDNSNGSVKQVNESASNKKNVDQEHEYFKGDLNATELERKAVLVNRSNLALSNGTRRIEKTYYNLTILIPKKAIFVSNDNSRGRNEGSKQERQPKVPKKGDPKRPMRDSIIQHKRPKQCSIVPGASWLIRGESGRGGDGRLGGGGGGWPGKGSSGSLGSGGDGRSDSGGGRWPAKGGGGRPDSGGGRWPGKGGGGWLDKEGGGWPGTEGDRPGSHGRPGKRGDRWSGKKGDRRSDRRGDRRLGKKGDRWLGREGGRPGSSGRQSAEREFDNSPRMLRDRSNDTATGLKQSGFRTNNDTAWLDIPKMPNIEDSIPEGIIIPWSAFDQTTPENEEYQYFTEVFDTSEVYLITWNRTVTMFPK